MPLVVCNTAMLQCSFGQAPCSLIVIPKPIFVSSLPVANIMDFAPVVNIPTFGLCSSPANPVVIAATAAKLGVFTPAPCVPATVAPWLPTVPTVMAGFAPILANDSKCFCMWGGVITVTNPAQMTVNVQNPSGVSVSVPADIQAQIDAGLEQGKQEAAKAQEEADKEMERLKKEQEEN